MFDLEKLKKNREKSIDVIQSSKFHQFIHADIIDRLEPLDKEFNEILIIKPAIEKLITEHIEAISSNSNITYISKLDENMPKDKFDLIVFPLGFHWISDIKTFLSQIKSTLKENGIFICSFPGAGTLRKLRLQLIELEASNKIAHTPHISPFIQFEQLTPILQHSGFIENIIDMEPLELEYDTPLDLMKALKNHGEANILTAGANYSITKKMYNELGSAAEKPFSDLINLITFISSPKKNSIKLKFEHYQG